MRSGTGGEGKGVEKHQEVPTHLLVARCGAGVTGDGGSAETVRRRRPGDGPKLEDTDMAAAARGCGRGRRRDGPERAAAAA